MKQSAPTEQITKLIEQAVKIAQDNRINMICFYEVSQQKLCTIGACDQKFELVSLEALLDRNIPQSIRERIESIFGESLYETKRPN